MPHLNINADDGDESPGGTIGENMSSDGVCGMIDNINARDHFDPLGLYTRKKKTHAEQPSYGYANPAIVEGTEDILRVWKEQTKNGSKTFHVHTKE